MSQVEKYVEAGLIDILVEGIDLKNAICLLTTIQLLSVLLTQSTNDILYRKCIKMLEQEKVP